MGVVVNKLVLLIWKNWIMQIRHPIQTVMEIGMPIAVCALLTIIRTLVDIEGGGPYVREPFGKPFGYKDDRIAYSPNCTLLDDIMRNLSFETIDPYPNAAAMELAITSRDNVGYPALEFDDSLKDAKEFPDQINLKIRYPATPTFGNMWQTNRLFPKYEDGGPRDDTPYDTPDIPGYFQQGFLRVQYEVSKSIMNNLGINHAYADLMQMVKFPYPEYEVDVVMVALKQTMSFIIILAFIYSAINITKVVTIEKEQQLKESMKIMGLSNWMHWTAWFIKSLSLLLISLIIMTFILKTNIWYNDDRPAIIPKTNWFIIFLFMFLYVCATITFAFMVSTFFDRANLASTFVWILYLFFYMPYTLSIHSKQPLSLPVRLVNSLLFNTAMGHGLELIIQYEMSGTGLQWNNMFDPPSPVEELSMGPILLLLLFDAIFYMLIALYVEAVFPGIYGVPKKWYFIFTFWMKGNKVDSSADDSSDQDATAFEDVQPGLKAGIEIRNLYKIYPNKKVAVKNISLNVFENQITVLLGHNGAGKTTTISILTGMYKSSDGIALVNGYNVKTDMDKARKSLGICPQHNILFDELTVEEHIYFYGRLRGMSKKDINEELTAFLDQLNLTDKINQRSSTLSGGMKRKLSVAVAFSGSSKVVLLDEPTAGMDPAARRALWEFIDIQKSGRTILLTTHFMDEADILGDRIAIMSEGQVKCCGSSFFLKKRYGAGYNLIIEKGPTCQVDDVSHTLKSHIPDVEIQSNVGTELVYLLPKEYVSKFEVALRHIEENTRTLDIKGYGISLTTLEEVFMKIGSSHAHSAKQEELKTTAAFNTPLLNNASPVNTTPLNLLTGSKLLGNQLFAMFMKRFLSTIRGWPLIVLQVVLCVSYIAALMFITREIAPENFPALKLDMDTHPNSYTPVIIDDNIPFCKTLLDYIEDSTTSVQNLDKNANMVETIIDATRDDPPTVRYQYPVAFECKKNKMMGYFNAEPLHSPPVAIEVMINAIFKDANSKHIMIFTNYPYAFNEHSTVFTIGAGDTLSMNFPLVMAFILACTILFHIKERTSNVKHLQFVSGVNIAIFWCVSYVWDIFTYICYTIIFLCTILAFQESGYTTFYDMWRLFIVCLLFAYCMLPIVYLISLVVETPSTGFTRLILLGAIGMVVSTVYVILAIEDLELEHVAKIIDWIFVFFPVYALSSAIRWEYYEFNTYYYCEQLVQKIIANSPISITEEQVWEIVVATYDKCPSKTARYYQWERPGILREILISVFFGSILMIILFMIESKSLSGLLQSKKKNVEKREDITELDFDYRQEINNVDRILENYQQKDYAVLLSNVTKYYKKFLAVNKTCLAIQPYECFGLLGVNGAGKTTTFQMITGALSVSSGNIYVYGLDLQTEQKTINKMTGYCPQFDALFDELTTREIIKVFALLRGYERHEIESLITRISQDFDIEDHLDKKVKQLSGGNRRKLSAGVAVIGEPSIVYLDEPTTGMDPASKRHIWDQICKQRDKGKSIILTSHSMEECEALCTRLVIMVNGQIKCIGSVQHLKNRFSPGYMITIKLSKQSNQENNVKIVMDFVKEQFPSSILKEKSQLMLVYQVPDTKTPWSKIFGIMESAKDNFPIEDYSIGQSSLEQVFLQFTYKQE